MFYDLKSIAFAPAARAMKNGATLTPIPSPFYSGGYTYTHVLTTKRGTSYVVCRQFAERLQVKT